MCSCFLARVPAESISSPGILGYDVRPPGAVNGLRHFLHRGVAQPGSAPPWGGGGRRFKSSRPDQFLIFSRLHPFCVQFS
jgi:hypothetical protein